MRKKHHWVTPEEIEARRQMKSKLLYLSIPLGAVIIGVVTSLFASSI